MGKLFVDPTVLPGGSNCGLDSDNSTSYHDVLHCGQGATPEGHGRAREAPAPQIRPADGQGEEGERRGVERGGRRQSGRRETETEREREREREREKGGRKKRPGAVDIPSVRLREGEAEG